MELHFGHTLASLLVLVSVAAIFLVFQSFGVRIGWELGPPASDANQVDNQRAGVKQEAGNLIELDCPKSTQITRDPRADPAVTSNPAGPVANGPQGCILFMDDRRMDYTPTEDNSATFFEDWGVHLPYWVASRFINRVYAKKHGYRFVTSTGKEFIDENEPRETSWYKVLFMKQQLQCCCQWVFFLDSDAYFRMDNHELSIESWLGNVTTKDYFKWEEKLGINLANQTWFPEDPLNLLKVDDKDSKLMGAFGRNGDNLDGWCGGREGEPDHLHPDPSTLCNFHVVNSGAVMMRNSTRTLEFLDLWWNEPNKVQYHTLPYEQPRFNWLFHQYADSFIVVPFRDLTAPGGLHVRHFMRAYGMDENRDIPFRHAVLSLVAKLEMESGP